MREIGLKHNINYHGQYPSAGDEYMDEYCTKLLYNGRMDADSWSKAKTEDLILGVRPGRLLKTITIPSTTDSTHHLLCATALRQIFV